MATPVLVFYAFAVAAPRSYAAESLRDLITCRELHESPLQAQKKDPRREASLFRLGSFSGARNNG
jgi:hypothetical protein